MHRCFNCKHHREYVRLTNLIEKKCIIKKKKEVPIIIFLDAESSKIISSILYKYKGKVFGKIRGGLSIVMDNRNEKALRLYRFNNDQRIDFTHLNEKYQLKFLHEKEFLSVIELPENQNIHNVIEDVVEIVIA